MALSNKDRKRRQREREREMGVAVFNMSLTATERMMIRTSSYLAGYEDQTEYLLDLVRKDRDVSRQKTDDCSDCRGRGCFSCCNTEAEIRLRDIERVSE